MRWVIRLWIAISNSFVVAVNADPVESPSPPRLGGGRDALRWPRRGAHRGAVQGPRWLVASPPTYGSDPSVSVNGDVTVPDGGSRDKAIPTSLQPHHGRTGSSVGGDRGWPEFEVDDFDVVAHNSSRSCPVGRTAWRLLQGVYEHRANLTFWLRFACEERLRRTTGADGAHRGRTWMRPVARVMTAASWLLSESSNQHGMRSGWRVLPWPPLQAVAVIAVVTLRRSWSDQLQPRCSRHV